MDIPIFQIPACPKCGSNVFGIKEFDVQNANYRHYAVLCAKCGCIVGTETMQDDQRHNELKAALDAAKEQIRMLKESLQRHGIY